MARMTWVVWIVRHLYRLASRPRKPKRIPTGVERGNAFSIFVIILVILTLLTLGWGSGGLADLFKGLLPQQTSEVSETGKGTVHFEVTPNVYAKYWKTGSYDLYKTGYWVRTYSSPPEKYEGTNIDTGVKNYSMVRGYTLDVKVSNEMTVIPTMLNTVRVEITQPSSAELVIDDHGIIKPAEAFKGSFRITYLDYSYSKDMLGRKTINIPSEMAKYLSLSNVTQDVIGFAKNLTMDVPTPFERMMYLATYVRHAYGFTPNYSHPPGEDPISYFMFKGKRGSLKEFAGSLVLMGRAIGIPTRLVSGFVLGSIVDSKRIVTQDHAHYWAEAYFGSLGWIPFEASPGLGTLASVTGYDIAVRGGGNGGPRMRLGDTPPDLAPSAPYSMPDDLFPNTPFMLYLQVNNQGERVVNWFEIALKLGYDTKETRVDLAVYPREEAMVPLRITLTHSGPQECNLILDPNNKIYESDKSNNQINVTFNVISGIDLIISIDRPSVSDGKRAFGENIDAIIKVENLGDLPAFAVAVIIRYGTSLTTYFNISTIQGNSVEHKVVPLPALPEGTYALTAFVDPFNTIPELNETNNADLVSMLIIPRFKILKIDWIDETGDAEFGPGDLLIVEVQSNLSPGADSRVMVKESDQNGEMKGNLTLPRGESSKITIVLDHAIADLVSARVIVVEL